MVAEIHQSQIFTTYGKYNPRAAAVVILDPGPSAGKALSSFKGSWSPGKASVVERQLRRPCKHNIPMF